MQLTIKTAMIGGTAAGGIAGAMFGRNDDTSKLETGVGVAGSAAGGYVAGKYGGPQIRWTLAERAHNSMVSHQKQVMLDLKTGDILRYDQNQYLKNSAEKVAKAKSAIMSAAAPSKVIIAATAAIGSAAAGFGLLKLAGAFND